MINHAPDEILRMLGFVLDGLVARFSLFFRTFLSPARLFNRRNARPYQTRKCRCTMEVSSFRSQPQSAWLRLNVALAIHPSRVWHFNRPALAPKPEEPKNCYGSEPSHAPGKTTRCCGEKVTGRSPSYSYMPDPVSNRHRGPCIATMCVGPSCGLQSLKGVFLAHQWVTAERDGFQAGPCTYTGDRTSSHEPVHFRIALSIK